MRDRAVATLALLVAGMMVSMPVLAEQQVDPPEPGKNVRIKLVIGIVEQSDEVIREYSFLARDKARPTEMMMGWRVPIPTSQSGEGEGASMTSFVYQNVGVTVQVEVNILPQGRIRVSGQIEASGSEEGPHALQNKANMPVIGTFQQAMDVILDEGKPLRLAEVPHPDGGRRFLEMTASTVD